MSAIVGALIIGALASLLSASIASSNNTANIEAQKEANQQNLEAQTAINQQSQYNIEHAHQIEMADLKAAGLNPILTATGGNGAPQASLQAPQVKPVMSDLSGVNTALSGLSNMMMMMMFMNERNSILKDRVDLLDKAVESKAELNEVRKALGNKKLAQMSRSMVNASRYGNSASSISQKELARLTKIAKYNWLDD